MVALDRFARIEIAQHAADRGSFLQRRDVCDLFAAESEHRIDLTCAAVLTRPRDDCVEREISRDIQPVHGLQSTLARETKAELNDFVARFRQLPLAELRVPFRDHLLRPLHGHPGRANFPSDAITVPSSR